MNKLKELYTAGVEILKNAGITDAEFDALCLLEHTLSLSRVDITLCPEKQVDGAGFIKACETRALGTPLQYILGEWEFMGLPFYVSPDVLIPRADTETLVEYVLEKHADRKNILDMCCGSGCIGLSVNHFLKNSNVTLCDISENALEMTRKNAKRLGLDVEVLQADLTKGGNAYFEDGAFDLILSNPPYITTRDMDTLSEEVKREPYIALWGGDDGALFYRPLICEWDSVLADGGTMALEVGYDTADTVCTLFCECGYSNITRHTDLNGVVRVISATKGTYNGIT